MEKKIREGYCIKSDSDYLCNPFWKELEWEFSLAGSVYPEEFREASGTRRVS